MTRRAVKQITPFQDRTTTYVWSELAFHPIDFIGQTAYIEVTTYGGRGLERAGQPTRLLSKKVYSGVIRSIIEDHGKTVTEQEATPQDTAEGAVFEEWGTTTIFTDHATITFTDDDHVEISVFNRP